MIGKIISQLLGNAAADFDAGDSYEDLMEFEEEGWVIVNVSEDMTLSGPLVDPLENMLIEHPSMSVYQVRCETNADEEDIARPVAVRQHISWRLAAWGVPLMGNLQRAQGQGERRKMSRGALHRQNLATTRLSPVDKRFGQFKQPVQRLYNY